jgi:hypothetical protein
VPAQALDLGGLIGLERARDPGQKRAARVRPPPGLRSRRLLVPDHHSLGELPMIRHWRYPSSPWARHPQNRVDTAFATRVINLEGARARGCVYAGLTKSPTVIAAVNQEARNVCYDRHAVVRSGSFAPRNSDLGRKATAHVGRKAHVGISRTIFGE